MLFRFEYHTIIIIGIFSFILFAWIQLYEFCLSIQPNLQPHFHELYIHIFFLIILFNAVYSVFLLRCVLHLRGSIEKYLYYLYCSLHVLVGMVS